MFSSMIFRFLPVTRSTDLLFFLHHYCNIFLSFLPTSPTLDIHNSLIHRKHDSAWMDGLALLYTYSLNLEAYHFHQPLISRESISPSLSFVRVFAFPFRKKTAIYKYVYIYIDTQILFFKMLCFTISIGVEKIWLLTLSTTSVPQVWLKTIFCKK